MKHRNGFNFTKKCYDNFDYRKEISLKADVSRFKFSFVRKNCKKFRSQTSSAFALSKD